MTGWGKVKKEPEWLKFLGDQGHWLSLTTQRWEHTELRWEADEFDLGHCEFEVPMGKHLSYRHKRGKQIREVPAPKWL